MLAERAHQKGVGYLYVSLLKPPEAIRERFAGRPSALKKKEDPSATGTLVRAGDGECPERLRSRHEIGCRDLHDISGVVHQKHHFLPRV